MTRTYSDQLHECLECLSILRNKDAELDLKKFKWDIFAALHNKMIEKLDEPLPSSSSNSNYGTTTVDGRLLLGELLIRVYDKISASLEALRHETDDEFKLVSLADLQILSVSFQFFILTNLLPFYEDGIGLPPQRRSNFIKQWKPLTSDVEFQREKLLCTSSCMERLLSSNEIVKVELIGKYLDDVICTNEQIFHLEPDSSRHNSSFYKTMLTELPREVLIPSLLRLSRRLPNSTPPPVWLTAAIGNHLSAILIGENGLQHMLNAYQEMGGPSFWENTPMLESIAHHFALPPRGSKRQTYYQNLTQQFFHLLEKEENKKISLLFAGFCEEMRKRDSHSFSVLVLDRLFQPWERILETGVTSAIVSMRMAELLSIFSLYQENPASSNFISSNPRILELLPLFLDLLSAESLSADSEFVQQLRATVKCIMAQLNNKAEILVKYAMRKSYSLWQFEPKEKKLITVIEATNSGDETIQQEENLGKLHLVNLDVETILCRRVQTICGFVKETLYASSSAPLLCSLAIESVKSWTQVEMKSNEKTMQAEDELPRFVAEDVEMLENSEWIQLASHLMADWLFEQLAEADIDPTDENVLLGMTNLAQIVLHSTRTLIETRLKKHSDLDVVMKESEETSRIFQLSMKSSKMVVALAGAIVMFATTSEKEKCQLGELSMEMRQFVRAVEEIDSLKILDESLCEELRTIASDAAQLADLLLGVGIEKAEVEKEGNKKQLSKKSSKMRHLPDRLKEELDDEMEPIRGQALLVVSKEVRKRNPEITSILDEWLYAKVKDLVFDADSYVYLMSINALGEIALFDSKYLNDLIDFFVNFGKGEKQDDDSAVIVRGKVAETIGRVFRWAGDFAPVWFDRFFSKCVDELKDPHDIMRASALSTLSDLLLACRGKGIGKYLTEIFATIETALKHEESDLVRRAAVHLLRQCIRSAAGENLFEVLGPHLRDLRRTLSWLMQFDKDHVVRLHAQLAIEEIAAIIEENLSQSESGLRQIRI